MTKHYHDDNGIIDYSPPEELVNQLIAELPESTSKEERQAQRGDFIEQAIEIVFDYHCSQLVKAPLPEGGTLQQVFNDYITKGYMPEDFLLCAWDLITQAQFPGAIKHELLVQDAR